MSRPKRGGLFEVGQLVDIYSRVDEIISQKLDRLLQVDYTTSSPSTQVQDACLICLSVVHSIGDCPATYQFFDLIREQVHQAQTHNVPRLVNNPCSNTYNPGWRNHPIFFLKITKCGQPNLLKTQLSRITV